ncbi:MAG: DUF2007 domain-containing protein [bacterium]
MFCPVCQAEYQPGIKRCVDDNAELVPQLGAGDKLDSSEARFVHLHHVGSPVEAEMVNDILKQNGIRSAVQSGGADALSPLLSSNAEGSLILVDERDFDKAQELYEAFFGDDATPLTGGVAEVDEDTRE